eukprot:4213121-Pyramimonas_sp.AAC.1
MADAEKAHAESVGQLRATVPAPPVEQQPLVAHLEVSDALAGEVPIPTSVAGFPDAEGELEICLLYTSDAADDTPCVDL